MICLESLGVFTDTPKTQSLGPLGFLGVPEELARLCRFCAALIPRSEIMGDFLRISDHLSYWDEGFPAIMLTDTAMCRNTHYHKPSDTPDKLNYPVMALLTERVAEAAGKLAKNFVH